MKSKYRNLFDDVKGTDRLEFLGVDENTGSNVRVT
jgi:hypothetical protein